MGLYSVWTTTQSMRSFEYQAMNPPRILCIVTYWNQPEFLKEAIASLLAQSRPADAIIVVDDASEVAPDPAVMDAASVSFYRSPVNVGTFHLIDSVIHAFPFDWYLIQDCDDIAAPTRLARLLQAGLETPADMVGSSIRNFGNGYEERIERFAPEGSKDYLAGGENFYCPWGASLIRRSLWEAVDGLSGGLRLGGDTEFLHRVAYIGRVINIPTVELHRRRHPESLTLHADTGETSKARIEERSSILGCSARRRQLYTRGAHLDLRPQSALAPVSLTWIAGPVL